MWETVLSSDLFYNEDPAAAPAWRSMGVLCTEMECAALYMNAARAGKKALGILTISDHIFKKEALSAQERQTFLFADDGDCPGNLKGNRWGSGRKIQFCVWKKNSHEK